jgi:hypothetical protein
MCCDDRQLLIAATTQLSPMIGSAHCSGLRYSMKGRAHVLYVVYPHNADALIIDVS